MECTNAHCVRLSTKYHLWWACNSEHERSDFQQNRAKACELRVLYTILFPTHSLSSSLSVALSRDSVNPYGLMSSMLIGIEAIFVYKHIRWTIVCINKWFATKATLCSMVVNSYIVLCVLRTVRQVRHWSRHYFFNFIFIFIYYKVIWPSISTWLPYEIFWVEVDFWHYYFYEYGVSLNLQ